MTTTTLTQTQVGVADRGKPSDLIWVRCRTPGR